LLGTHPTKTQQLNDPTRTQKIELKRRRRRRRRRRRVLTHAYQQGRFTSNKKLGSCRIREKRKKSVKIFSGLKQCHVFYGVKRKKMRIF